MTLNEVLLFIAQVFFVLLSLVAIFDYITRPNPRRRDFALFCSALGLPLGGTLYKNLFGVESGLIDLLGAFALFSQPYFLFRLLRYFRPSPRWLHWLIITGTIGTIVVLVLYIANYPATTQAVVFGFTVLVDAYCTWEYSRAMRISAWQGNKYFLHLAASWTWPRVFARKCGAARLEFTPITSR